MSYEPGEKFLRVIQLFTRLCETESGVTTKQLADELEVNQRTVQRYVATLRDSAGIDIDEADGRLRIGSGSRLPPMQLDRYQATLLLIALRLLHQLRPEQDPALVGSLAQLSGALRVPLVARYLERTLRAVESRPLNVERRQVERTVIDGFVDSRAIEVQYVDSAGRESRRVLRPYFLEPAAEGRHIYVFAHDAQSGEVRPFRLDRIGAARPLPQTFQVPDDFDIDSFFVNDIDPPEDFFPNDDFFPDIDNLFVNMATTDNPNTGKQIGSSSSVSYVFTFSMPFVFLLLVLQIMLECLLLEISLNMLFS